MNDLKSTLLTIVAEAIYTVNPLLALVVAAPAVPLIKRQVHAFPPTASRRELALDPTLAAVLVVRLQVDALVVAAVRSRAALQLANFRVLAAFLAPLLLLLVEEAASSSKRRWLVSSVGKASGGGDILGQRYFFFFFFFLLHGCAEASHDKSHG